MAGKRTSKAANSKKMGTKKAAPKARPAAKKAPPKKSAKPTSAPKSGSKSPKPKPKAAPAKQAAPAAKAPVAPAKKKPSPVAAGKPSSPKPAAPAKAPAPVAKGAGKAQPKGPTPAQASGRGAMLPPRPSTPVPVAVPPARPSQKPKGETLTLVPARSSSTGIRPRELPTRNTGSTPPRDVTLVRRSSERPSQTPAAVIPIPVRKVEAPLSTEERFARIEKRLEAMDDKTRKEFYFLFDQAWVSHDSALEGTVYTREELEAGFSADPILTDSSLQPAADEIRRHREAIEFVRDAGLKKKLPVTVDTLKKIFLILHPSEGDLKTVRYRKDIPQHRLYFHEYAAPDKIIYKVRQVIDWLNLPETKKTRHALRIAARAHYDLLRVFPFQTDSGKVARLFMNLLLYRSGYPAAIIHAKERQTYYEALKGEPNKIFRIVQDSVEDGLGSIEKLLDEQDARKRSHSL